MGQRLCFLLLLAGLSGSAWAQADKKTDDLNLPIPTREKARSKK
jgi:hypothetical protein